MQSFCETYEPKSLIKDANATKSKITFHEKIWSFQAIP